MTVGIIAEYNPFHNGHIMHIEQSKKITKSNHCIVAMSGNFVQRGEPAICNKQIRTKAALLNGADLVIEIPVIYATASADIFAYGSVNLLDKTGIVDFLCFGSEEGNINTMLNVSETLSSETNNFKEELKKELKKGISYPSARLKALSTIFKKDLSFLSKPNNILAIEYLKTLKTLKSNIKPYTIKREYADFNSTEISGNIASATAIRNAIMHNDFSAIKNCTPSNTYEILIESVKSYSPSINDYSKILHYIIRTQSKQYLSSISDITEGIENRILKNAEIPIITDLLNAVKTKRYTYTKLQRSILHIILDIKKSDLNLYNFPYIRILGFRKESSNILNELVKKSKIPLITNIKNAEKIIDENGMYILEKEIKSTDLYYINSTLKIGQEYKNPIVIV